MPDEAMLAEINLANVKVDELVKEFLTAQSLTILPQNSFGDAVAQYVEKDDKHAMEMFVNESLANQLKHLMEANEVDEAEITNEMEQYRSQLEDLFASGRLKKTRKSKLKPKPRNWDSDEEGPWYEQPGALIRSDNEKDEHSDDNLTSVPAKKPATRGHAKAAGTTRQTPATTKKAAPATKSGRRKKVVVEEEEEEDEDGDAIMISDDDEEESTKDLFVKPARKNAKKPAAPAKAPARAKSPVKKSTATTRTRAPAAAKQTTLNFSQPSSQRSQPTRAAGTRAKNVAEPVSPNFIEFTRRRVHVDGYYRAMTRFLMMMMTLLSRCQLHGRDVEDENGPARRSNKPEKVAYCDHDGLPAF